jgi:1,4-dihydroxy-6-naphthoate synthase
MKHSCTETRSRVLKFGHSPDPDDAFMFFGLAMGAIKIRDFGVEHVLEDIQTLNEMAIANAIEITAISAHAFPAVQDDYWIMHCGASMGKGYGPIIVALPDGPESLDALGGQRVAIPGPLTTAYLVARLYLPDFEPIVYPFDQIPAAVVEEQVDAGLVIHEGQITYGDQGLVKLGDLGALWLDDTGLPLPLGLDVVSKNLGPELAGEIARGLSDSIRYAFDHEDDAVAYALDFGRGLDTEQARTFVKMYVNDYTRDMGDEGHRALRTLFDRGFERGLIEPVGSIELI